MENARPHARDCACPACHHRRFLDTFRRRDDESPAPIGPGLLDRAKADLDEHAPYYESP